MKYLFSLFFCLCYLVIIEAQDISTTFRLDLQKEFELSKKFDLKLIQTFQFNPEIKDLRTKSDEEIFNEIDLFPFSDDENDEDEDEDDEDEDDEDDDEDDPLINGGNSGFKELNDQGKQVKMEWRSSSTASLNYELHKRIDLTQQYTLLLDNDEIRHLTRSSITFQPKLSVKKLTISQRLAFQLATDERKGKTIFENDWSIRNAIKWSFKKRHSLYTNTTFNGAFDEKIWEWDRFRLDTGIQYSPIENNAFDFGYRFQQRLTGKKRISHGVSFRYILTF